MYDEITHERGDTMPQEGYPNLIGAGDRSPEEARANGAKGGVKSGESRRRKKTLAEGLRALLDMPENDPAVRELLKSMGLEGTTRDALNLAQIKQAGKGDSEAYRLIRDTIGEKPREGIEIGNLDDKPLATVDLSTMTDDQLRALAARRAEMQE